MSHEIILTKACKTAMIVPNIEARAKGVFEECITNKVRGEGGGNAVHDPKCSPSLCK